MWESVLRVKVEIIRYGRIMGYLNQEEGLYPNSYNEGKYNGHDFCNVFKLIQNGLHRMLESDGSPDIRRITDKCKLVQIIDVDSNGNPTTKLRLDIPTQEN